MNITYLITMAQNKLIHLQSLKQIAELNGDLTQVRQLDNEILETQNTLNKLSSL